MVAQPKLLVHCGGSIATLDEVQAVPVPEKTATYSPVAHGDLIHNLHQVAADMLQGYEIRQSSFALAKGGNRMFGLTTFNDPNNGHEMGPSIAYRNSYDKSMKIGLAIGKRVFCCDNLALTGDMTVTHVHKGDVIERMKKDIITCLYGAKNTFVRLADDAARLKCVEVNDDEGFRFLGHLVGEKLVRPTEFNTACREWRNPSHDEFGPRTAWSLYNAVTEGLKAVPMNKVIQSHIAFHDIVDAEFLTMTPDAEPVAA